jgi:predicted nucleic acid-binding protein
MNGISVVSDTNPLIYLLDGNRDVAEYLDGKHVWVSVITELELFAKKGLTQHEKDEISILLESCFIADLNNDIKEITKNLTQKYMVKLPDAIIAATSIYLDLPFLSADSGFKKIQELDFVLIEI